MNANKGQHFNNQQYNKRSHDEQSYNGNKRFKAAPRLNRVMFHGREVCNNFNLHRGCFKGSSCDYAHVCHNCKSDSHTKMECGKHQFNQNADTNSRAQPQQVEHDIGKAKNYGASKPGTKRN